MGFFSKIFKGVKKVFKKIGKGIKGAFKKFGKFMGKIGILGQVAMFFVMPYIGQALGSMWTGIAGQTAAQTTATAAANSAAVTAGQAAGATAAEVAAGKIAEKAIAAAAQAGTVAGKATGLMAGNAVARGVGHVMQFTANAVSKVGTVFNNITKGVTDTLGNFAKTASNKMFGTSFDAASNFFTGGDTAFSRSFGDKSRFQNLTSSESVFEQFKEDRLAETEAKLNTSSGEKAITEAVAESGGDPYGFDSQYGKNIQAQIDAGNTNLTASLDPTIQDTAGVSKSIYKTPTIDEIKSMGTQVSNDMLNDYNFKIESVAGDRQFTFGDRVRFISEENFKKLGQIDDIDFFKNFENKAQPSLLERFKTGIKDIPDTITKKAGEIADDPLGYAFKGTEESLQKQMNLRVGQELGISEKPVYNQQYVSNAAYVPPMSSFASPQSQYGAQEIMDARAFEQQVTFNPNPYGYTAFQYGNYMSQFGQTA